MTGANPRPLKGYKTYQEQIDLLRSRGMIIRDEEVAIKWLKEVGYYRLSLYSYHFRNGDGNRGKLDLFQDHVHFEEVVSLYIFDRKLRYLVFSGIEKIEVSLRARMGYHLGQYGPNAYRDAQYFRDSSEHAKLIGICDKRINQSLSRNDEVAKHHEAQYGGQFPFWVLTDLLDFADLSKFFAQLRASEQRRISKIYGLKNPPRKRGARVSNLEDWLHQISLVRNFTAHHAHLWDRKFGAKGVTDAVGVKGYFESFKTPAQSMNMYGVLTIMAFLLEQIEGDSSWAKELAALLEDSFRSIPNRSLVEMGFPREWKTIYPWNQT